MIDGTEKQSPRVPERLLRDKAKQLVSRPNTAVAYVRVSTKEQTFGASPEVQRSKIESFAENEGVEIIKWFGDSGVSGKTVSQRKELQQLLAHCKRNKNKIGYVLFYNMRRASRDTMTYYSEVKAVLKPLNIGIRSASEPNIDDSPTGEFLETVQVASGALDNTNKSTTTKDNMRSVASDGWWQGQPPLGWSIKKIRINPQKKRSLLVRGDSSLLVKELLETFARGEMNQVELAKRAVELGLRNSKGKHPEENAIRRMLTEAANVGYICNKTTNYEMFEGKHINDALIDTATFDTIQRRLNMTPASQKARKSDKGNPLYPLGRGFMLCSNCKKSFYYSAPTTGGKKSSSPRYHCTRAECRGIVPSIKADEANDLFIKLLKDIAPSREIMKLYKEILNRVALKQYEGLNRRIGDLRDELTSLDTERKGVLRKWARSDSMTIDEKDDIIEDIDAERDRKATVLDELLETQRVKESQIDYALTYMGNPSKYWKNADLKQRRRFQKLIFPEGVFFDSKNRTFGTDNISPIYRYKPIKKDPSKSEESLMVIPRGIEPRLPG